MTFDLSLVYESSSNLRSSKLLFIQRLQFITFDDIGQIVFFVSHSQPILPRSGWLLPQIVRGRVMDDHALNDGFISAKNIFLLREIMCETVTLRKGLRRTITGVESLLKVRHS